MTYEYGKTSLLFQKIVDFVSDDLNTVGALGVVFENLSDMKEELCSIKLFLQQILGLSLEPLPEKQVEMTEEILSLIQERETARRAKDWVTADAARQKLLELGFEVQDKKKA